MTIFVVAYVQINYVSAYKGQFVNQVGTVVRVYDDVIGVKFDSNYNTRSKYGAYWFKRKEIDLIESEMFLMNENCTVAHVQFLDGTNQDKTYAYALYDEGIIPNDLVVVKTGHHGMAVAKVISIGGNMNSVSHGREIICKVDTTAYDSRKEKAKKVIDLKVQMDKKVQHLQQTAIYEMLAEKDPELAAMLNEYKALLG